VKFCKEVIYKKLSIKVKFRENRLSDIRTLLKGVSKFLPVLSIFTDWFRWNSVQKISN